jgi:hypothetical protein
MKLTRRAKIAAGIATAIYIGLPFIVAGIMILMAMAVPLFILASEQGGRGEPPEFLFAFPFILMSVIFPLQCGFLLLTFGMITFYLAHIIKNRVASDTTRIILAVGLVFMPFIAMPIYYLMHVWPEQEATAPQTTK